MGLRQLLRPDGLLLRLREGFMKNPGCLRLLLPVREVIDTAVQARSKLLSRGMYPRVILQRWLRL